MFSGLLPPCHCLNCCELLLSMLHAAEILSHGAPYFSSVLTSPCLQALPIPSFPLLTSCPPALQRVYIGRQADGLSQREAEGAKTTHLLFPWSCMPLQYNLHMSGVLQCSSLSVRPPSLAGVIPTLQPPGSSFARVYAVYGGVFVVSGVWVR